MSKLEQLLLYIGQSSRRQSTLLYPYPQVIVECDPKELIDLIAGAIDWDPDVLGMEFNRIMEANGL